MLAKRVITSTALMCIGVAVAFAADRKLTRNQMPPAVLSALDKEAQGATIKGYGSEREHGKTSYEVETIVSGHTRDLSFAEDGSLLEVEEEVAFDSLPASVQSALKSKAAGAIIQKVESLTKQGKLVAFEASTLRGSKKGEIQVGPLGQKLTHEE